MTGQMGTNGSWIGTPGKWTGHQKLGNPTKQSANAIIDVGSKKGTKVSITNQSLWEYLCGKTTGSGRLFGVEIELAKAPRAPRTK